MIPCVHFTSTRSPFKAKNPFIDHNIPVLVFIDSASFDKTQQVDFLLRQADGVKLRVISTTAEGNSQLHYLPQTGDILGFKIISNDGSSELHSAVHSVNQYKQFARDAYFTKWAEPDVLERAFIVAKTFESINAHIFITNDAFLLEHRLENIIADSFPLSIDEALALIGLIFRRRNQFDIIEHRKGSSTMSSGYDRASFFWYGARELLPEAWGLVTGCAQLPSDKCRDLALTAISRTVNALKCRDHIHEQLMLEQDNSSTEDAIFYLDYYMLSFMAAFDVLARIADEIYQPVYTSGANRGNRISAISWRRNQWLNELAVQDPSLASLMTLNSPARDVLEFIARLRNYIHAEGLQGSIMQKDSMQKSILLHIPQAEVATITSIIHRISGGSWTTYNLSSSLLFLEIGELVEKITPITIQVLNNLMKAIDISRIPGIDLTKVQKSIPFNWPKSQQLVEIRSLLGL